MTCNNARPSPFFNASTNSSFSKRLMARLSFLIRVSLPTLEFGLWRSHIAGHEGSKIIVLSPAQPFPGHPGHYPSVRMMRSEGQESRRRPTPFLNQLSIRLNPVAKKQAGCSDALQKCLRRKHQVRGQLVQHALLVTAKERGVHLALAGIEDGADQAVPSSDRAGKSIEGWHPHDLMP